MFADGHLLTQLISEADFIDFIYMDPDWSNFVDPDTIIPDPHLSHPIYPIYPVNPFNSTYLY